ncbi:MAG TPA: hypothetical protein VMU13_03430 [Candidatus Paceibacterota bacterium]|nr:hypothetical protein [Candidatus Paceibacterota bacterium]
MMKKIPASSNAGFTLIETLAAITLLLFAIIPPMALTVQSLTSADYARDQITASNLAQEGIEAVRAVRDGNILSTAEGTTVDLFKGILPTCATACYVDMTAIPNPTTTACGANPCPNALNTNGQLYSYHSTGGGWVPSNFTRTIRACYINGGVCNTVPSDEVRLIVTVSWKTAAFKTQSVILFENLYNWPQPGSASP